MLTWSILSGFQSRRESQRCLPTGNPKTGGASASSPGLEPSSLSMKYKTFENYYQFYLSHFQGHPVSVGHFQASIEVQKLRHKGGSQWAYIMIIRKTSNPKTFITHHNTTYKHALRYLTIKKKTFKGEIELDRLTFVQNAQEWALLSLLCFMNLKIINQQNL